jgi:hypothetical protein
MAIDLSFEDVHVLSCSIFKSRNQAKFNGYAAFGRGVTPKQRQVCEGRASLPAGHEPSIERFGLCLSSCGERRSQLGCCGFAAAPASAPLPRRAGADGQAAVELAPSESLVPAHTAQPAACGVNCVHRGTSQHGAVGLRVLGDARRRE